ncbi:nucleotidyltransferase domain-containing protein [Methanoculleus chikugoensis]|uniref:nucleotidyltransferase family protein n=1 Tax=Methanoculleus chikugoensis TaxID=118126 RepID=UPI001FB4DB49|nr:nucleotidyltransferase domain-containing protein [Methanoculleus chikugoensis]
MRTCGFDLQCRETSARRVMEQVRALAREIRARRRVSAIILYGSFSRGGDFHEESDVDLIVVGDFPPERPHKHCSVHHRSHRPPGRTALLHRQGVRRPDPRGEPVRPSGTGRSTRV